MAYTESRVTCDYCQRVLGDGAYVACRPCYEILENRVADLEEERDRLKDELDSVRRESE